MWLGTRGFSHGRPSPLRSASVTPASWGQKPSNVNRWMWLVGFTGRNLTWHTQRAGCERTVYGTGKCWFLLCACVHKHVFVRARGHTRGPGPPPALIARGCPMASHPDSARGRLADSGSRWWGDTPASSGPGPPGPPGFPGRQGVCFPRKKVARAPGCPFPPSLPVPEDSEVTSSWENSCHFPLCQWPSRARRGPLSETPNRWVENKRVSAPRRPSQALGARP